MNNALEDTAMVSLGGVSMTDLTKDERLALQMWMRHAIAQIEMKEAQERMATWFKDESKVRISHHAPFARRSRRPHRSTHVREMV